jgi:hypothetical protein
MQKFFIIQNWYHLLLQAVSSKYYNMNNNSILLATMAFIAIGSFLMVVELVSNQQKQADQTVLLKAGQHQPL